jgi:transcription elongation factor Elf1
MIYTVKNLRSSLVLFPEASYSFDGKATPIPASVASCVKKLGIPVVMIRTYGAFARDPLYNNLQRRKVKVSATEEYILSPEDIERLTVDEIAEKLNECFDFDNFSWQKENKIKIKEKFRADGLNRILYKCPHCHAEGEMVGRGTEISCKKCGKSYYMDEYGTLSAKEGVTEFSHIPDWYDWERKCVREEIERGEYSIDLDCEILMTVTDYKFYRVGEGRLRHDRGGFVLDGCEGKLHYEHKPLAAHSVNSDFYYYQMGDVISFGNNDGLFYCFPKIKKDVVAKARLATEELYKIVSERMLKEKSKAQIAHFDN